MAGKNPAEVNSFKKDPGIGFSVEADSGYQIRVEGIGGINQSDRPSSGSQQAN
jgi:hypothetical protein